MSLSKIHTRQYEEIDALANDFVRSYDRIAGAAVSKVSDALKRGLAIRGGKIDRTAGNRALLQSLDKLLVQELNSQGLGAAIDEFTSSFNGQFKYFREILSFVSKKELGAPLPFDFDQPQLVRLEAVRLSKKELIREVSTLAASRVKSEALLAVGAVTPKELTEVLRKRMDVSSGEAASVAETSISTFYRSISEEGYQKIEREGYPLRYRYDGPLDKLNRPFCLKISRQSKAGKKWTRKEIAKLSNGQMPNVFVTCGGYRCRHQWIISDFGEKKVATKQKASRQEVQRQASSRRSTTQALITRVPPPISKAELEAKRSELRNKLKEVRNAGTR